MYHDRAFDRCCNVIVRVENRREVDDVRRSRSKSENSGVAARVRTRVRRAFGMEAEVTVAMSSPELRTRGRSTRSDAVAARVGTRVLQQEPELGCGEPSI